MAVDLSTHSKEIAAAYEDVTNTSSDTNWLLLGYEGKTNALKVVDTGEDGLEELVNEFNSGACQFAYCQVTDPNTSVFKHVLINWSGEGAPIARKSAAARDARDVERVLHGAHVTINARSEADLDVPAILKKVAAASGANYSIHKEKVRKEFANDGTAKVGTNYTNEFKSKGVARDEAFWQQQQDAERARLAAEQKAAEEEQARFEAERRRLDQESESRRAQEMQQREASMPEPEPEPEPEPAYEPEPEPAYEPEPEPEYEPEPEPEYEPEPEPAYEPEPEPAYEPEPEPAYEPEPEAQYEEQAAGDGVCARAIYDYQAQDEGELTFDPDEIITGIEQIDEGWWQGWCRGVFGLFPANYVELI